MLSEACKVHFVSVYGNEMLGGIKTFSLFINKYIINNIYTNL